ncbi:MAG: protein kinase [Lachnospiraceae bacterium]|nr:protein kinase [Lachnospiraceae bacterium]
MQNVYGRCPNCMKEIDAYANPCPHCGFDIDNYNIEACCLWPFTVLQGKYMLGKILGIGGFGISYLGWDINLKAFVAIKEYFPDTIAFRDTSKDPSAMEVSVPEDKKAIYDKGLTRYVEEARNLSKFYGLQGIVSVKDFFYANGTGYIVMEYISGTNLKEHLSKCGGKMDEYTVLTLMKPVFESLAEIHKTGLIHRDISPDNIMFDDMGNIKLIDFGAVREQSEDGNKTYTVMLKHGYAPQEQYFAKGKQGPWTDIYSLCATMFRMLTGVIPPNCIERMSNDTYTSPSAYGVSVSYSTEAVINKGLSVKIEDRYQNIDDLMKDLYANYKAPVNNYGATYEADRAEKQDNTSAKKSKSKLPLIIGGIVLAVALIVILVKVFVLDKKDNTGTDSSETATVTDASTDMTTTEATTTEATTTEEEVILEGDWTSYSFMINDDFYQLPMTYDEWISYGWECKYIDYPINSGEIRGYRFTNGDMECTAYFANYKKEVGYRADCAVIGFGFDQSTHEVSVDGEIRFPGDIVIDIKGEASSNNVQAVLDTYGEAANSYISEYVSVCEYYSANNSYICFYGNENNGALYSVSMLVYSRPEGAEISSADAAPEVLSVCAEYVAPGYTTDRFDEIYNIDGVNYKMPMPFAEFLSNGWEYELVDPTDTIIKSNETINVKLYKGEAFIEATIGNPTIYQITPEQAKVYELTFNVDNCAGVDVTFPGGVTFGNSDAELEGLYSDINNTHEDAYTFLELSGYNKHTISYPIYEGKIYFEMETRAVEGTDDETYYLYEYTCQEYPSASSADPENTDYIQGITIN